MSAGGCGSGQRSTVSALRGSGPPLVLGAPVPPPTGGGGRPSAALYGGGVWVGGSGSAGGGRSAALSPSSPPAPIAWVDGVRPSPASSLVWGLGLWRWRVLPAVAPVGEGVAQSPGEPVVGIRIRDAEHRPPLQESWPRRLPVKPRRRNHRPEDPLVVLWGRPPPRGHLPVPPVPPEEHGIEGPDPHPRGGRRDADWQRIQFEFAEFAANSFAVRIRCEFGLKFLVLRIRGEFALRIRGRRQNDPACAVFSPDEKLTLNCAMQ